MLLSNRSVACDDDVRCYRDSSMMTCGPTRQYGLMVTFDHIVASSETMAVGWIVGPVPLLRAYMARNPLLSWSSLGK